MRPCDGHAVFDPHELREHVRPPNDGNAEIAGLHDLWIVRADRGRRDHHIRAVHIVTAVTDIDAHPHRRQALCIGAFA